MEKANNSSVIFFSDDIKKKITNVISAYHGYNIEVEFRFSQYYQETREDRRNEKSGFITGVNYSTYYKLNKYLLDLGYKHESLHTIDETQNIKSIIIEGKSKYRKIRKSINLLPTNNIITWEEKINIDNYDDNINYYIRIGVSAERKIEQYENFKPDNRRVKKRESYYITGNNGKNIAKIDLTYVESDQNGIQQKTYEVELELLDFNRSNEIEPYIKNILSEIQNTENIYSINEYNDVVSFVNNTINPTFLGYKSSYEISNRNLHQARNLKFQDMVWGGLIGNSGSKDNTDKTKNYTYRVSIKADGLRKLLVFHNFNIWMVMGPGDANLISRSYMDNLIQIETISNRPVRKTDLNGYILEGEFIPIKNRKNNSLDTKYIYYAFDTLSTRPLNIPMGILSKGDTSIQNKYHHVRMDEINKVIGKIYDNNKILQVVAKKFIGFYTVNDFYSVMRDRDQMRLAYPFKDDGFIFMPDEMPYSYSPSKLKRLNSYDRTLVNYPDICKWKPPHQLTIDFAIQHKLHGIELYVSNKYYNQSPYVELKHINALTISSIKLDTIINGDVYKFKYINNLFFPMEKVDNNMLINENEWLSIWDTIKDTPTPTHTTISQYVPNITYLRVIKKYNNIKLYVYNSNPISKLIKFKHHDKISVDKNDKMLKDLPSGTVVEFMYEDGKFIPERLRHDKKFPNAELTANDTWNRIIDPITIDTMKGLNFRLMRKYHNKIKSNMYQKIKGGKYLLDIGSGGGGDIQKWKNINLNKIVAVEPNMNNILEFKNRLMQSKYQNNLEIISSLDNIEMKINIALNRNDKVILINTGGEDFDLITSVISLFIPGGKVDVVVSMLSLSFFWLDVSLNNSRMLDGLIKTIHNNITEYGKFYYLTIDGDIVQEYMKPAFGGPLLDTINFYEGEGIINYNHLESIVQIYLKNTIVTGTTPDRKNLDIINMISFQSEGLVKMDDLLLKLTNMDQGFSYRADQEGFLSSGGRLLSSMYSYGNFIRKSSSLIISTQHHTDIELSKKTKKELIILKNIDKKISTSQNIEKNISMLKPTIPPTNITQFIPISPRIQPIRSPISKSSTIDDTNVPIISSISSELPIPNIPFNITPITTTAPSQIPTIPLVKSNNTSPILSTSQPSFTLQPSFIQPQQPTIQQQPLQLPSFTQPQQPTIQQLLQLPSFTQPQQPTIQQQPTIPQPPTIPQKLTIPQQPTIQQKPTIPQQPLQLPSFTQPPTIQQPLQLPSFTQQQPPLQLPSFTQPPTIQQQQPPLQLSSTMQQQLQLPSTIQQQPQLQLPSTIQPELPLPHLQQQSTMQQQPQLPLPLFTQQPIKIQIPIQNKYNKSGDIKTSIKLSYDSINGEAYGDNKVENIKCSWYTQYPVVRISSAGPYTCFIECILNSFDNDYQKTRSYREKQKYISQLKYDLQNALLYPSTINPNKLYGTILSESTGNSIGQLKQMMNDTYYDNILLNYISEILSIGIYIYEIDNEDIKYVINSKITETIKDRGYVLLGKSSERYELLGVKTEVPYIQTIFNNKSEIIIATNIQISYNTAINYIYNNMSNLKLRSNWDDIENKIIKLEENMRDIANGLNIKTQFNNTYNELNALLTA